MTSTRVATAAELFESILTQTDNLSVGSRGALSIEGCAASELLMRFGSPLYVISEQTLRDNFKRIRAAFRSAWPAPVNVLYAIKANNNLSIRAILDEEGAGGDCFGEGELWATFEGGADPDTVVLNGSNKSASELRHAVDRGVTVNVDAEEEIDILANLARERGKIARVTLRLKLLPPAFARTPTDYFGGGRGLLEYVRRVKWGFSIDAAEPLVRRLLDTRGLSLRGYHFHIGRASRELEYGEAWARALGRTVVALHQRTGYAPGILDVGGGWPRERDPESRTLDLNALSIEEYVGAVCGTLRQELERVGMAIPELWAEPGRFIVGNAVVLLATVGAVKRDCGLTWVNVDASTNDLPRIDTSGSAYHVVPAAGMHREAGQIVTVVGSTCTDSVLAEDRLMPDLLRGEPIAVLDAGMYAETASSQLNGVPRPATVLVSGSTAEVVKERETVEDVFAKHRIPARLRSRARRR